jgi:predicted metal-dependent hydrolase
MRKQKQHRITLEQLRHRIIQWIQKLDVKPKEVHIRLMRNKWASCSTAGRVSFSRELLRQKPSFRDYVIVHELLHLQVPNHGKLFKSLMNAYVPNWEKMDRER